MLEAGGSVTREPITASDESITSNESAQDSLADYLLHFGLEKDPFENTVAPFFGGANREQLLAQLLHLCQFSASAVAVLGEPGMGKSCLKEALLSRFSPADDICSADIPISYSAEDLLGQIVQGFELDCDPRASRGQLLAAIRHFGQSGEEGSLALLIIENAQNLDDRMLGALLSLLQGQGEGFRRLHILLFAEPQLAERLDGFGIVEVLIHDLYLEPFSLADVAEYLQFRLEAVGFDGELPFDEEDLECLYTLSQGVPAALHDPARERLIQLAAPAPPPRTLPLGHLLAVVILGTGLLLALFYRDDLNLDTEQPETHAVSVVSPAVAVAERRGTGVSAVTTSTIDAETSVVSGSTVAENPGDPSSKRGGPDAEIAVVGEETLSRSANRPQSLPKPLNPRTLPKTEFLPAQARVQTKWQSTPEPSGRGAAAAMAEYASDPTESASTAAPASESASEQAGRALGAAPRKTGPASVAETSVSNSAALAAIVAPAAGVESSRDQSAAALSKDEAVIMKSDKTRFTLQVLAVGSKKSVEEFIARQDNKGELKLLTTHRKGRDWFVVITGEFADASSARRAIAQLPREQQKAGPWPRSLLSVQNDIRSYHGI